MRRSVKTVVDVLLVFGLVFMGVTGFALYLSPSGRVARETGWNFLGVDRHTLSDVHTFVGFAMICIALLHLALNWKPFVSLLKTSARKKSAIVVAVLAIAALVLGAYFYSLYSGSYSTYAGYSYGYGYRWRGGV